MADRQLTIKQEKYAQGLFAGLSQREAYKQAYDAKNMKDKQIDEEACKLADNPKVTQRLQELTDELKERNMVTVEKILAELAKVGFANGSDFAKVVEKTYMEPIPAEEDEEVTYREVKYKAVEVIPTNEIDSDKLAAIAGIKSTRDGIEIKTNDKIKALELMGKHLGMFTDKIDLKSNNINTNHNIDYSTLPNEALEEIAKAQSNDEVMQIISKYRK